jgi:hypothetical protein
MEEEEYLQIVIKIENNRTRLYKNGREWVRFMLHLPGTEPSTLPCGVHILRHQELKVMSFY